MGAAGNARATASPNPEFFARVKRVYEEGGLEDRP